MAADADKALKDAVVNRIAAIERHVGALNPKASESEISQLRNLVAGLQSAADEAKTASYATLDGNSKIAEEILSKVGATTDKIDELVEKGRPFNASQARQDLHDITARVAEILSNVDLAQPWVENDLRSLAERTAHIHGLFAGAK